MTDDLLARFATAARWIDEADSLIIAAGAGMGVDSGLPDFRGTEGFWNAYPALGRARIRFEQIASPRAFRDDPELAWGFYGHRLALYRATLPHAGFGVLRAIGARMPQDVWVFTSNVDGQFQRAGFDDGQVVECHGSIHHLQCLDACSEALWSADEFEPVIDDESSRMVGDMPRCPTCGALARPAILMFGDWDWNDTRSRRQSLRFSAWRNQARNPVVIELGAGQAIPSVREFSHRQECPLIRINPREWDVPLQIGVGIPTGALQGLLGIQAALDELGWRLGAS